MALGSPIQPRVTDSDEARKRALLSRIASSASFQKSQRARELLDYLGRRTLESPGEPPREQDIGVAVFGRPPGYDTSQDTLVRVQASHLRKKLEQYFEEEGREEQFRVRLPKGGYHLQFYEFEPTPAGAFSSVLLDRHSRLGWLLAALLLGLCTLLIAVNRRLESRLEAGLGPHPAVDRLWRQMFDNGHQTHLLLSDLGLLPLQDALQHHISLAGR